MQRIREFIRDRPIPSSLVLLGVMFILAFVAWAQYTPSAFSRPSAYDIFPLLGLMGFSALLATYVVNAASTYLEIPHEKMAPYYQNIGYIILILILSHPTALVARLYIDGYGLPPASYSAYVSESYVWVVWLGTLSLLVFLAFEFHRWFSRRSWWKYVVYANDIAMFLVLYHGLTLGTELRSSWLKYVWWFYGIVLVVSLVYLRFYAKRKRR